MGNIDARGVANGLAIPTPAQIQAWFPDPWMPTPGPAAISPWVRTYSIGVGDIRERMTSGRSTPAGYRTIGSSRATCAESRTAVRPEHHGSGNEYAVPPFVEAGAQRHQQPAATRRFAYKWGDRRSCAVDLACIFVDLQIIRTFMAQIDRLAVMQVTSDAVRTSRPIPSTVSRCQLCSRRSAVLPRAQCGRLYRRSMQELMAPEDSRSTCAHLAIVHRPPAQMVNTTPWKLTTSTPGSQREGRVENMIHLHEATVVNYPFRYRSPGVSRTTVRSPWSCAKGGRAITPCRPPLTKAARNRWQGSATYTLSGLWDGHAGAVLGNRAGAVPDSAGHGRRVHALGLRPSPSRRAHVDLAGGTGGSM